MVKFERKYEEIISRLSLRHESDRVKVMNYLESIACQLDERFPEDYEFVRSQVVKASQLSLGYEKPVVVLRDLDRAIEKYLGKNSGFVLFDQITQSTPVSPRSLDEFVEEIDFLVGGCE